MFSSLRSRLFITYLATAGLVLALIGVTLLAFFARSPASRTRTYENLEATAELVLEREQSWDTLRPATLNAYLSRLESVTNVRAAIIERQEGRVVANSRPGFPLPPQATLQDVIQMSDVERGEYQTDDARANWLFVAAPLSDDYSLFLTSPGPTLRNSLVIWGTDFLWPLLRAAGVALVLSVVFAWWMSSTVSSPLKSMVDATRAIASGETAELDALQGPIETRVLAEAFNRMSADLRAGQQAQRDFIANVSHDLRTPLTSIQGFAQALRDGTVADTEGQQQAVRVILEEAERLNRLVEDLLDLARMDAGQMVLQRGPVDLSGLLQSVVERASLRADEAGVMLALDGFGPVTIIGDGDRLAQVFTNLVDNAIKHTPLGGQVRISSKVERGWITVHVDDQGAGIPAAELSRIFERFYQVDKARSGRRGVGLGLAIVREIVQAHGGRVVAQSEMGTGSRFSVQLPVVMPSDATLAKA